MHLNHSESFKASEMVNENTSTDIISSEEADAIGKQFVRQFYTVLSKNIKEAHKFYGHESILQFDDKFAIGQQKIGKILEEFLSEPMKLKIYSIKGLPSFNMGIVLQVCGEMNNRRFLQTFILGQQGAKKYYVQNDLLQYLDYAFMDPNPKAEPQNHLNNGHAHTVPAKQPHHQPDERERAPSHQNTSVEKSPIKPPTPAQQPIKKPSVNHPDERSPKPHKEVKKQHKEEAHVEPVKHVSSPQAPAQPQHESQQSAENKHRSWANLVGSNANKANSAPPVSQPPSAFIQPSHPQHPHQQAQNQKIENKHFKEIPSQNQNQTPARSHEGGARFSDFDKDFDRKKIHLGGITRAILPDSPATAEREIYGIFNKIAPVASVGIPRKVMDFANEIERPAFAFITMQTVEGAQKVLDMATKDEGGTLRLQLKIEAFGFDGLATVSEQKEKTFGRGNDGFRGRPGFQRNGFQQRGRGGPGPMGTNVGNPGRGGFRNGGGFHNQHGGPRGMHQAQAQH